MELKTKDGMHFIGEQDLHVIKEMSTMIPELRRSLNIVGSRIDEKISTLNKERDTCGKLKRMLNDMQSKLEVLYPKEGAGT